MQWGVTGSYEIFTFTWEAHRVLLTSSALDTLWDLDGEIGFWWNSWSATIWLDPVSAISIWQLMQCHVGSLCYSLPSTSHVPLCLLVYHKPPGSTCLPIWFTASITYKIPGNLAASQIHCFWNSTSQNICSGRHYSLFTKYSHWSTIIPNFAVRLGYVTSFVQQNISGRHMSNKALRRPYRILQNLSFPSKVIKESVCSQWWSFHPSFLSDCMT